MVIKKKLLAVVATVAVAAAVAAAAVSAVVPDPVEAPAPPTPATAHEYRQTIEAMKPPKRTRPVVAVIGDNRGTEAIDFLVPYGVLKRSDAADVFAVGMTSAPLKLRPALTINAHLTAVEFDQRFPTGADYVVVPAMFDHETPDVITWIRSQAASGATIIAICSGAEILANAGLLRDRAATTHWTSVEKILATDATVKWVPHRRYVADRGIVSTTGVSAAMPVSIALVEAIAGPDRARELARQLGVREWDRAHDSGAYRIGEDVWSLFANRAASWKHEDVAVPVAAGVDDIALALTADTWSRTYRSRALTLAALPKVRTRYGLELIVDRNGRQEFERMLPPVEDERPADALDRTLGQIESSYGRSTARLVEVQLEYRSVK